MPNAQSVQTMASASAVTSGSKMFDWSTQERVSAVPHDIWPGLSSGKGLDRIFVGRERELAHLTQRHSHAPETVDSNMPADERSFVTEVTIAPGVGKAARRTVEHPGRPTPKLSAEQAGRKEENWFGDDDE